MWIDYRTPDASTTHASGWFCKHFYLSVAVIGAIANFASWCVADVLYVYFPDYFQNTGWLAMLLPVPAFLIGMLLGRRGSESRWSRAVIGAFFALILSIPLIFFLGVYFHLLIGGTL